MQTEGFNQERTRAVNRSAVLRLISDRGALSRKDIASALSLTPPAVTQICAQLMEAGVLSEQGEVSTGARAGRKKRLVGFSKHCPRVLTLSVEAEAAVVSLCDVGGAALAAEELCPGREVRPEQLLALAAKSAVKLMEQLNIPHEQILGMGVSVPGPVDRQKGISLGAYRIWDEPASIAGPLSEALDLPVIVENNVLSYAEGELIYGDGRSDEGVLLIKWGPGVGSAAIIDGRVFTGKNGLGPEIGHSILVPGGKPCRCGRRGCLETCLSTHALCQEASDLFDPASTPALCALTQGDRSRILPKNAIPLLSCGDKPIRALIEEKTDLLALASVNAATLLALGRIRSYGSLFRLPGVQEDFAVRCARYMPELAGMVAPSALNEKAVYIGPLAVAVNRLFLDASAYFHHKEELP